MRHPVACRLFCLALITAITCAVPMRAGAHPAPVTSNATQGTLAFDTHLVGNTKDNLSTLDVEVEQNALDTSVILNVSAISNKPTRILQAGSRYQFHLPAKDLTVSLAGQTGQAHLNTHHDLGAYGFVTADWTITSSTSIPGDPNCVGLAAGATITSYNATFSKPAQIHLNVTCDGTLIVAESGTSLPIDSGVVATATTPGSPTYPMSFNMTTTAATWTKSRTTYSVAGTWRNGGTSYIAFTTDTSSAGAGPLADESHFAMDALAPAPVKAGAVQLRYSGNLASADLLFTTRKGRLHSTKNIPLKCMNESNTSDASVTMNSSSATVTGSSVVAGPDALAACMAFNATLGNAPNTMANGSIETTSMATGGATPAATSTPAAGGGGVPTAATTPPVSNAGGKCLGKSVGGMCITAVSPKSGDAAAGVKAVTVTFASAAQKGVIAIAMLPSDPSGGAKGFHAPDQAFSGTTATIPVPPSALAPGKYSLIVVAWDTDAGSGADLDIGITLS
jgi:hypothetical protein